MRNQNNKKTNSDGVSKFLGCFVLLFFIFFEELWIGTAACALAFVYYYVLQVFIEKSRAWYSSWYLYATIGCGILAWMGYQNGIISNFIGL